MHKKIKQINAITWIDQVMWIAIIMFVGLGSFSLGMVYEQHRARERHPIEISYSPEAVALWEEYQNIKFSNTEFFASKNGSVVYPVGCKKGERIKEENRILFTDIQQALDLGYREASGC